MYLWHILKYLCLELRVEFRILKDIALMVLIPNITTLILRFTSVRLIIIFTIWDDIGEMRFIKIRYQPFKKHVSSSQKMIDCTSLLYTLLYIKMHVSIIHFCITLSLQLQVNNPPSNRTIRMILCNLATTLLNTCLCVHAWSFIDLMPFCLSQTWTSARWAWRCAVRPCVRTSMAASCASAPTTMRNLIPPPASAAPWVIEQD